MAILGTTQWCFTRVVTDFVRDLRHKALTTEQAEAFLDFLHTSMSSTSEKPWITDADSDLSPFAAVPHSGIE